MKNFVSFNEARALTLSHMPVMETETLPLATSTGKILSEELVAKCDSPSTNASRMDGFAVLSEDLRGASRASPVKLKITGRLSAGCAPTSRIARGQAVGVTTGAPVPAGADAVLPSELCVAGVGELSSAHEASPGENILPKGTDIHIDQTVASRGEQTTPPLLGLLASAGLAEVPVHRFPRVAVIATGDEVVAPGETLAEGKLFASNLVEISSWLSLLGFPFQTSLVGDQEGDIEATLVNHLPHVDAFVTSGGVWGSERDLILKVLLKLKWQGVYHRVRMAPGKSTGFGLLEKKPFFCLPGGPSSNETAFLQLALPGLLAMAGYRNPCFPRLTARLSEAVKGKKDWTQFVHAKPVNKGEHFLAQPLRHRSRLLSMAKKEALIIIPEGCEELAKGEKVDLQLLRCNMGDVGAESA